MNEAIEAATEVAAKLRATEEAIDAALIRATDLCGGLPTAWSKAGISGVVGLAAFDRAGSLVATMTQARRAVGEMHKILDGVREARGLPEMGWGDKVPGPMVAGSDNVVPIAA